jgi:hypothetical protein
VFLPADLNQLSRDATAIVRGQIVAVDAQWTDDRRTIETLVTLQTDTYLKGSLGEVVQFRVPGGSLGRFRSVVVGAPTFAVGQRVIVFLGSRGPTIPYVLGMSQGVFRLSQSPQGGWMVTPPGIMAGIDGPVVRGTRGPMALTDFEREIRVLTGTTR